MSSPNKDLTPSEKMRAALPGKTAARSTPPFLLILVGVLSTGLVFACCFSGIALWWFRPITVNDPERARELTHQIVSISIPESFVPKGTVEWNVGFVMRLRGVYYERLVGDGVLSLLEVNTRLANDDTVRRHIRETLLEESSRGTTLVVDPAKNQKETLVINGEPVMFNLDIARDPRTNEAFRLVEGVFQGNSGQVLLSLRVDSNRWLDEAVPLDSLTTEEADPKLPGWLKRMLHSIGGNAEEPAHSEPVSPVVAPTPAVLPENEPVPAPGPLQ
ncbi:MAG TPA: hypothetical protein VNQ76_14825 [Planctomicrobium sp.]|nr:hypothetical protein [Planctomicrobium sp.]